MVFFDVQVILKVTEKTDLLGLLFTSITTARVFPPRNYMLPLTDSTCFITAHAHSLNAALERMVKIISFLKRIFGS